MLKKIILKAELLTIKNDILQTSFIDLMVYPISRIRLSFSFEIKQSFYATIIICCVNMMSPAT